jgi:hypothetical protein
MFFVREAKVSPCVKIVIEQRHIGDPFRLVDAFPPSVGAKAALRRKENARPLATTRGPR